MARESILDSGRDSRRKAALPFLPFASPRRRAFFGGLLLALLIAARLSAQKEITIVIDDYQFTSHPHALSVASALRRAGVVLYPADAVTPPLGSDLRGGETIQVSRAIPVVLRSGGLSRELRTQAATVGELLHQAGIPLRPGDRLYLNGRPVGSRTSLRTDSAPAVAQAASNSSPGLSFGLLTSGSASRGALLWGTEPRLPSSSPSVLTVVSPIEVHIHDDGIAATFQVAATTVGQALKQAGITIYLEDQIAPKLEAPVTAGTHIYIQRAKAVLITTDAPDLIPGGQLTLRTHQETVAQALEEAKIRLTGRETIEPAPATKIAPGIQVHIRAYRPLTILVDGVQITTRSRRATVAEVLADEGVSLNPPDQVKPGLEAEVTDEMIIVITRVTQATITEEEPIPYRRLGYQPDGGIELDEQVYQPGRDGVFQRRVKVTYTDGRPVYREVVEEWVERQPVGQVTYYGTKIVIRKLETPDGVIEYWRKMTVFVTYYHASTSGKEPGHPEYGVTFTGKWATRGVIAVDPRVIPLHTKMYVPGYGHGAAEDTGGEIKGKWIDLFYEEGQSDWGSPRYVTIYLLTPVPDDFPYVLPE